MLFSKDEVLIVGAGPTGLTLACCLAKQRIKCQIIDKRKSFSTIPRAINLNNSTLEILSKLGIIQDVLSEGLQLDELVTYWKGKRLFKFDYKNIETPFPYFFHLEQNKVELHLKSLLQRHSIYVQREAELLNLWQKDGFVTVAIKDSAGQIKNSEFSYVIGCDGGNSTVRKLSELPITQKQYSSHFILVDAEISNNVTPKKLRYYLDDEGYLIIAPLPNNKYRLIASFKNNNDRTPRAGVDEKFMEEILKKRSGQNIRLTKMHWSTSSEFYHKIASKAFNARVFIAGDAFHQFSPVGGTNMNAGIMDAYVLAEKLTKVIKEKYSEEYLTTYEKERLISIQKILNSTFRATCLLTRNENNINDEEQYLPLMKNRKFFKEELPGLFSGKAFTH